MHYQWLISVFLKNTSLDQLLQKAYCVKHKPDAWCMAGDFFLLLEMTDLDKLKSKREIIVEKRMHDSCQHKYGL